MSKFNKLKALLFVFYFCFVNLIQAQEIGEKREVNYVFKIAPLSLLDVDAGIQAGVEKKLIGQLYLQVEASILFYQPFYMIFGKDGIIWAKPFSHKRVMGYTIRSEIRNYYTRGAFPYTGSYVALALKLKYVSWEKEFSQYKDLVKYNVENEKQLVAFGIKSGYQKQLNESKYLIDLYMGVELRYRRLNYETENIPQLGVVKGFSDNWMPGINLGLKLGF